MHQGAVQILGKGPVKQRTGKNGLPAHFVPSLSSEYERTGGGERPTAGLKAGSTDDPASSASP
jgi:hypothetical protein